VLSVLGLAAALGTWWLWPPRPYAALPDSDSVNHLRFSSDGALVAAAKDNTVLAWETVSGRLSFALPGPAPVTGLAFSPDGRLLAVRAESLSLIDAATREERPLAQLKPGEIPAAFAADGKTLLVTLGDSQFRLLDVATGSLWGPPPAVPRPHPHKPDRWGPLPGPACRFSPCGRRLLFADDGLLRVFDVASRKQCGFYSGVPGQFAFAPDGETWAVAVENEVVICAAPAGEERVVLRGHSAPVTFVAWSPDGRRLASLVAGEVAELKVWDVGRRQELATLSPKKLAGSLGFSPDGRFLCLADIDLERRAVAFLNQNGVVALWDLNAEPPRFAVSLTSEWIVSPHGGVVAAIGDPQSEVRPWTIAQKLPAASWQINAGNDDPVFTPDGKLLILAGSTTTVRGKAGTWLARWAEDHSNYQYKWVDVSTWQVRALLDTEASGILSPDGRLLAVANEGKTVRLWRVPPRRPAGPGVILTGLNGALAAVILWRRRRGGTARGAAPAVPVTPNGEA
jgi:WD40 repeat protein